LNGTSWYDRVHKLRSVRHALLKYHRRAHYCDVLAQPQIGPKGLPRYLYVSRVYQQVAPPHLHRDSGSQLPRLHRDWVSQLPRLHRDWGALLPRLHRDSGSPLAHLHRDWAHPLPHLRRDLLQHLRRNVSCLQHLLRVVMSQQSLMLDEFSAVLIGDVLKLATSTYATVRWNAQLALLSACGR
jgi:hypothetical protein